MKKIIGLFAHVDAGKTTLSEAILFESNVIKEKGRVDKGDSFLDYNSFERKKGITVLSKEARFKYNDNDYILVDTPGHLDFLSEVNRTIKIVDIAIIIIDAKTDIPQDTIKKYQYLNKLNIPTIIFVNKMDITYDDEELILNKIKNNISNNCVKEEDINETIALNNEDLLDDYLNHKTFNNRIIYNALCNGDIIPVFFGSAHKQEGIKDLLNYLNEIELDISNNEELKAYVYKVDEYVHLKVISGILKNKSEFNKQKINEILLFNGQDYIQVQEVIAKDLCAIKGLKDIEVGTYLPSLYNENDIKVQTLKYLLLSDLDSNYVYEKIKVLNKIFPELDITLKENETIVINISGELQKDYLKEIIKDRFDIEVSFSNPLIIYKETITKESIGVGHYEPLMHYAEVILSIKPSNIYKVKVTKENNYTNNIKNYFETNRPQGILINHPLDNIEINILDIKTHNKHTQGQDIIEASKIALRNALINNESIILEPFFITSIKTNPSNINKTINTIINKRYTYSIEENNILIKIPEKDYNDFILNLSHNLKDEMNIQIENNIYDEAINQNEIIEIFNYDYSLDLINPSSSIFFISGQKKYIDNDQIYEYMHLDINNYIKKESTSYIHNKTKINEDELKRVWNSLYKERPRYIENKKEENDDNKIDIKNSKPILYLIDGYNLMHVMENVALDDLINAREKVIDLVCDFAGYVNGECILVFDAYRRDNIVSSISKERNITIVYTKKRQTADMYIEKKTLELQDDYHINVVTSDALEQLMIFSHKAYRLSSKEFLNRYENFKKNSLIKQDRYINRPLEKLKELLEDD